MYLNTAATDKCLPSVLEDMKDFLDEYFGDIGGLCELSDKSNKIYRSSKLKLAELINGKTENIYYTSSGAEANNWVANKVDLPEASLVASTNVEHASLHCSVEESHKKVVVKVNEFGCVDLQSLEETLDKYSKIAIFFCSHASHVTGNLNDIQAISKLCKKHNVLLHVDACQSFGKEIIDVRKFNIDFMSISFHKVGGPKGVGALYIKDSSLISPMIHGCQQNSMRGGTLNPALICGVGSLCDFLLKEDFNKAKEKMKMSISILNSGLSALSVDTKFITDENNSLPNVTTIVLKDINALDLSVALSNNCGVSISPILTETGGSGRVFKEMGLSYNEMNSTIRLSVSRTDYHLNVRNSLSDLHKTIINLRNQDL